MTTPGVIQQFTGTSHEAVIVAALADIDGDEIAPEDVETVLRDGVAKWAARRESRETDRLLATPLERMSPEERSVMRQRLAARKVQQP
jgi:hypothetical protein